jgi:ADP-ribosylglycohydrolase
VDRNQRVKGAVVGSAVGDALGAPFEFSRERTFSTRFPTPDLDKEMCGGGGWDPGEATDDTQMAVHLAESLLERGGLDLPDIFARFQRWAADEPKDIGLQTEDVLTNRLPWDLAASIHFQTTHRAAGNGSLMRATTSAVYFACAGQRATLSAARRIAALTHGDAAAWEGTAIFHELMRVALDGDDPLAALPDVLPLIDPRRHRVARPRSAGRVRRRGGRMTATAMGVRIAGDVGPELDHVTQFTRNVSHYSRQSSSGIPARCGNSPNRPPALADGADGGLADLKMV